VLHLTHKQLRSTEDVERLFMRGGEPAGVFERLTGPRSTPQALADAMEAVEIGQGVSFLVAEKVTGDLHVCAGATSFLAVCGPPALLAKLIEDKPVPTTAQTKEGEVVQVVEAWRGFGTLSYPGFRNPSFAPGWLVCNADRGFGFLWDGMHNNDMILLGFISSQDQKLFMDRSFLPSSCR
jgi:hypothetical protein